MNDVVETIEKEGLTLTISYDHDSDGPSDWGDDGLFLIANHREFYVLPPGVKREDGFPDAEDMIAKYKKTHHIYGLEAYIHSGVVLALSGEGNFCDRRWDVSQLGLVFASKKEWRLKVKARKAAEGLINTWNQWLGGDVYHFSIEDADGDHIDSCGGFYGIEHVREDANASLEHAIKERRDKKAKKLKAQIINKVPLSKR